MIKTVSYVLGSRESLHEFADIVGDKNPLHRDIAYAQDLGFNDTPVLGVYLEALAERAIVERGLVPSELSYVGHSFKFKEPAFPRDDLSISLHPLQLPGNTVKIQGSRGPTLLFDSTARFDHQYPSFDPVDSQPLHNRKSCLNDVESDLFYILTGRDSQEDKVPFMYAASQIPAALLEALEQRTGNHKGVSRSVDLTFHAEPRFGDIETHIYVVGKPKKLQDKGFAYTFKGVCSQNGQPIMVGELMVVHPENFLQ